MVCLLISLNLDAVVSLKYLFGLPDDEKSGTEGFSEENINYIQRLSVVLNSNINDENDFSAAPDIHTTLSQVGMVAYASLPFSNSLVFNLSSG